MRFVKVFAGKWARIAGMEREINGRQYGLKDMGGTLRSI